MRRETAAILLGRARREGLELVWAEVRSEEARLSIRRLEEEGCSVEGKGWCGNGKWCRGW